jgi:hypothetical protein
MASLCRFSVLRFAPDSQRGEIVNIGIALFIDNELSVHLTEKIKKILSISPSMPLAEIERLPDDISELTSSFNSAEDKLDFIKRLTPFTASPFGEVVVTGNDFNALAKRLIATYVDPANAEVSEKKTKLSLKSVIASYFERNLQLGVTQTDIGNHLVVQKFPISVEERLFSDFAYKNGVYRFAQVIDLNTNESGQARKLEETCKKAITLDKARRTYGESSRRFVVCSLPQTPSSFSKASFQLLQDYSDNVFDQSNADEMSEFYRDFVSECTLLHPM